MATANESSVSSFAGAEVDPFFARVSGRGDDDATGEGAGASAVDALAAAEQQRGALIAGVSHSARTRFADLPVDQSVRLLASLWTSFQQLKSTLTVGVVYDARQSIPVEVMRNYKAMQHRINLLRSAKIIAKCSQQPDALVVHNNGVPAKIRHMTKYGSVSRAFYSIDVSAILAKFDAFKQLLPEVQPEITAQTTGDEVLVSLFHQLGAGFRVQSAADVELLMTSFNQLRTSGLMADVELFSLPTSNASSNNNNQMKTQSFTWDVARIRAPSHVRAALMSGVRTFLIDSIDEAVRIQKVYQRLPAAHQACEKLGFVIAVKRSRGCNSNAALVELYAAQHARFTQMAAALQRSGVRVVGFNLDLNGVQYHELKRAFIPLQAAAEVFSEAPFVALQGIDAALLQDNNNCSNPCKFIEELRFRMRWFKVQHKEVKFTCDATRFLLKGTHTLTTRVIGSKIAYDISGDVLGHQFYIDDGCYGAFSRSVIPSESASEEFKPAITVLGHTGATAVANSGAGKTTIWGQTCDSVDMVLEGAELPVLSTDCWLSFNNMEEGCNTFCTKFNGFERAERRYFVSLAATA